MSDITASPNPDRPDTYDISGSIKVSIINPMTPRFLRDQFESEVAMRVAEAYFVENKEKLIELLKPEAIRDAIIKAIAERLTGNVTVKIAPVLELLKK